MLTVFDYVWDRFTTRLSGLTDHEYFWEPVEGCWSLRQDAHGQWSLDGGGGGGPAPEPVPITTIAWRLCHVGGLCLGGFTSTRFGDGGRSLGSEMPTSAAAVAPYLATQYAPWRSALEQLDDDGWFAQLGPAFGPFSEATTLDLTLHVLDEVVHHGGELGLMRDLYSQRTLLGTSGPHG